MFFSTRYRPPIFLLIVYLRVHYTTCHLEAFHASIQSPLQNYEIFFKHKESIKARHPMLLHLKQSFQIGVIILRYKIRLHIKLS